jgi:hypothetical protein
MTHIKETIGREITELLGWRDRLKVRAHLAKNDLKDAWDRIEGHWPEIQSKFKELDRPSIGKIEEIGKALKSTLDEIRSEYRRIEGEAKS